MQARVSNGYAKKKLRGTWGGSYRGPQHLEKYPPSHAVVGGGGSGFTAPAR